MDPVTGYNLGIIILLGLINAMGLWIMHDSDRSRDE